MVPRVLRKRATDEVDGEEKPPERKTKAARQKGMLVSRKQE